MSPILETLRRSVGLTGAAQPFYFDSSDHRLFGWLHTPSNELNGDIGFVICKPFGYEAICAQRGMRVFAECIQAAGMPALRFDYLGTGNSPEIEPEADQVEIWTKDVLAAVAELRRRTGVKRVCLLGFRLGALLATMSVLENSPVDALVLVAPIFSGRRYVRELRTTLMAASLGHDSDLPVGANGAMEVSGFSLSAATLASLLKVDLTAPRSVTLPPMLIVDGARLPTPAGPVLSPQEQQCTTRVALPGVVEMLMTAPQFALVPNEIVAATLEWISKLAAGITAVARPIELARQGSTELVLVGSASSPEVMRIEKPVFFGRDASLFGVVTQPPSTETRRRAVILINAGADYHIGASRLYVAMARRWAKHGYVVLRMDIGGIGESETRTGCTADDVFPQEALNDIRDAIEFLGARYGIRDVTLAGLCSGAYHCLRAAVAGLPVNRILMVNPQNYFWRIGETLQGLQLAEIVHNPGVYRERVSSLAAWKRLMTGRVNILRIAKIYLQRPLLTAESKLRDLARRLRIRLPNDLGSELEDVVARGVRVVFVFARGEPGIELLRVQAGNSVKRLGERCRIHMLEGGDHVFTRSGPREVMENVVSEELFAPPDRLDQQAAKFLTLPISPRSG